MNCIASELFKNDTDKHKSPTSKIDEWIGMNVSVEFEVLIHRR